MTTVNNETWTAVSLFAGVGGFDLAMQRQGIDVKAAVEIDEKARQVLAKQFPKTKLFDDVKEVTGEQLRATGFIPERGIITGGFPCQDLSVAGFRKGLAGQRSGLFYEIIRLVDELKPKILVLENVPGLLSSKQGQDMGIAITALAERGYGVCWRVLDSQNFGVPQRRRRVFIVASLGNHRQSVEILFEPESLSRDFEPSGKTKENITRGTKKGFEESSESNLNPFLFECTRVDDARIYDKGISPPVTHKWGGGGNNVPCMPMTFTKQSFGEYEELNGASTLSRRDYRDATNLIVEEAPKAFAMHGGMVNAKLENGPDGSGFRNLNEPSFTLLASGHSIHGVATETVVRRLTPKECERLQGFPDDWTADQIDSQRYKQMGNAVTVPVVEWIMQRVVKFGN
jgi:DNA (cytosine-5)-methyltransferase 1